MLQVGKTIQAKDDVPHFKRLIPCEARETPSPRLEMGDSGA